MGYIREHDATITCVACGARYKYKMFWNDDGTHGVSSNDHVCKPKTLKAKARRERKRAHESEESPYCECDDLDCKYEYLDYMMNEMQ